MDTLLHVARQVEAFLSGEASGHDWEHVRRVRAIAEQLTRIEASARTHTVVAPNTEIVSLIALLHEVDDHKITSNEAGEATTPNARAFLQAAGYGTDTQDRVCGAIADIGFRKSLDGVHPSTIEACLVSDADYLEAMGAIGIARCFAYGGARGRPLFAPSALPEKSASRAGYVATQAPSLNHFFDKLLSLRGLMRTEAGKAEATRRHDRMVRFVADFLEEASAPTAWHDHLAPYRSEK